MATVRWAPFSSRSSPRGYGGRGRLRAKLGRRRPFRRCSTGKLDVHGSVPPIFLHSVPGTQPGRERLQYLREKLALIIKHCLRKRRLSGQHAPLGESSSPYSK
jgi:hypothetical protein